MSTRDLYRRFYETPIREASIDFHTEVPIRMLSLDLDPLAIRVARRHLQRLADQPPGQRKEVNKLTKPINPPKGISKEVVKNQVRTEDDTHDDTIKPNNRDIQPKDVFTPKPRNMNVLNLVETGKDQDKVLRNQVQKDKGYDTVKNLSQYLVRTEGGGGTKPVG